MIPNRARRLVLALSLFAAVGAMLPGSHAASAAPIPATGSATELQWEVEQVKPKPVLAFRKLTWDVRDPIKSSNGITTYRFRLKAQGSPIGNVQVQKTYYINNGDGSVGGPFLDSETLGTMHDGEVKDVYVMCQPSFNFYCTEAIVSAVGLEGTSAIAYDSRDGFKRTSNDGY